MNVGVFIVSTTPTHRTAPPPRPPLFLLVSSSRYIRGMTTDDDDDDDEGTTTAVITYLQEKKSPTKLTATRSFWLCTLIVGRGRHEKRNVRGMQVSKEGGNTRR